MEEAVLDNPGKALRVTLLGREIDDLRSSVEKDMSNLREEVGRVFGLTRWLVGLMFASVFSLVVKDLLGKKPTKEKDDA